MIYAIIAAGEGSRLAEEGFEGLKPMVEIHGVMLIDRLIDIFLANKASAFIIIVNDHSEALVKHLQEKKLPVPLQLIVKSTPSSFHSFYELLQAVEQTPEELCLATTDSIFDEQEFAAFINAFTTSRNNDGLLAVTSFIDDESPLYIDFDDAYDVTEIADRTAKQNAFVSGGIYCLRKKALSMVPQAFAQGTNRMRNFQKLLMQHHLQLQAYPFSKILDIDHITDIEKAAAFLKEIRSTKNVQHVNG